MKKIISILLLGSLLLSNIGLVRIGDSCCSKTISAVLQPLALANCCCNADSENVETDDKCCAELNVFKKLNSDFEKVSNAESVDVKNLFAPKMLSLNVNSEVQNIYTSVYHKQKYVIKPPGSSSILFYKVYRKLILFA